MFDYRKKHFTVCLNTDHRAKRLVLRFLSVFKSTTTKSTDQKAELMRTQHRFNRLKVLQLNSKYKLQSKLGTYFRRTQPLKGDMQHSVNSVACFAKIGDTGKRMALFFVVV